MCEERDLANSPPNRDVNGVRISSASSSSSSSPPPRPIVAELLLFASRAFRSFSAAYLDRPLGYCSSPGDQAIMTQVIQSCYLRSFLRRIRQELVPFARQWGLRSSATWQGNDSPVVKISLQCQVGMIKSFLQGVVRKLCNQGWGGLCKRLQWRGGIRPIYHSITKGWSGKWLQCAMILEGIYKDFHLCIFDKRFFFMHLRFVKSYP